MEQAARVDLRKLRRSEAAVFTNEHDRESKAKCQANTDTVIATGIADFSYSYSLP